LSANTTRRGLQEFSETDYLAMNPGGVLLLYANGE